MVNKKPFKTFLTRFKWKYTIRKIMQTFFVKKKKKKNNLYFLSYYNPTITCLKIGMLHLQSWIPYQTALLIVIIYSNRNAHLKTKVFHSRNLTDGDFQNGPPQFSPTRLWNVVVALLLMRGTTSPVDGGGHWHYMTRHINLHPSWPAGVAIKIERWPNLRGKMGRFICLVWSRSLCCSLRLGHLCCTDLSQSPAQLQLNIFILTSWTERTELTDLNLF